MFALATDSLGRVETRHDCTNSLAWLRNPPLSERFCAGVLFDARFSGQQFLRKPNASTPANRILVLAANAA
jgi:hypothetical protein